MKISLKPISVNEAYRGRRFVTPKLKTYKEALYFLLPRLEVPTGKISVKYIFGCSSKGSDGDNLIKCFQDCIAKKYAFNDNRIYKWEVEKVDVKKGEEYIDFEIKSFPLV